MKMIVDIVADSRI